MGCTCFRIVFWKVYNNKCRLDVITIHISCPVEACVTLTRDEKEEMEVALNFQPWLRNWTQQQQIF